MQHLLLPVHQKGRTAMGENIPSKSNLRTSEFVQANKEKQLNLVQEFVLFVMENKKWWLIPILVVFALVGLLVVLGSSGAAPFIYTLF
jgi:hypothetical protein